eukprot:COSAG02_NODE_2586_length_8475_cov_96.509193_8_plen_75_part_00
MRLMRPCRLIIVFYIYIPCTRFLTCKEPSSLFVSSSTLPAVLGCSAARAAAPRLSFERVRQRAASFTSVAESKA